MPDANPVDYPTLLGRLQAETAAIIGVLLRRIEALDEEMAALRDRLDLDDQARTGPAAPPVEKLRWELIPQAETDPSGPGESGAWLVDRLRALEAERQTTWSNLVTRDRPDPKPGPIDALTPTAPIAQIAPRAILQRKTSVPTTSPKSIDSGAIQAPSRAFRDRDSGPVGHAQRREAIPSGPGVDVCSRRTGHTWPGPARVDPRSAGSTRPRAGRDPMARGPVARPVPMNRTYLARFSLGPAGLNRGDPPANRPRIAYR